MSEDDRATYLRFLELAVAQRSVAIAFADASLRHRRMEQEFNERVLAVCPTASALEFPHMQLPLSQYWQRNFFSILFLSVFDAVGISWSFTMAFALIASLPVILMFLLVQKWFIAGLTAGAVKG